VPRQRPDAPRSVSRLAGNFGQLGLGEGDPGDVEEISQEDLMEMWLEATG